MRQYLLVAVALGLGFAIGLMAGRADYGDAKPKASAQECPPMSEGTEDTLAKAIETRQDKVQEILDLTPACKAAITLTNSSAHREARALHEFWGQLGYGDKDRFDALTRRGGLQAEQIGYVRRRCGDETPDH